MKLCRSRKHKLTPDNTSLSGKCRECNRLARQRRLVEKGAEYVSKVKSKKQWKYDEDYLQERNKVVSDSYEDLRILSMYHHPDHWGDILQDAVVKLIEWLDENWGQHEDALRLKGKLYTIVRNSYWPGKYDPINTPTQSDVYYYMGWDATLDNAIASDTLNPEEIVILKEEILKKCEIK